ncbi:alcohol oxidase-like protein [Trametes elegans]|nr:alcohol oxidase-like protein [Trametes elegans]
MTLPHLLEEEFDIVIAGGGTAAGVIAGRLSAAAPALRILLLETGPHTQEDLAHVQPARFLSHLRPDTTTVRHIAARQSEHLGGRQLVIQCGQCVGGGSSVNFAMYTRPPASDYDDWARLYKNPCWSFEQLLPLIRKVENYQNMPGEVRETHGHEGPLKVSYGGYSTQVGEDFIATVAQYDKPRIVVPDANTMVDDVNHYERWPKWIDEKTGRRADVPHHFVYNQMRRNPNLHLYVGCSVRRVIIEDGQAVGVEYTYNPRVRTADNVPRVARASRMVVVSAGTMGSPGILERSGIGAKSVLKRVDVEQIVDLPGVGENYSDHPAVFLPFHAKEGTVTLDGIVRDDPVEIQKWTPQWLSTGKGLMSSNGVDGCGKVRPTPQELQAIGPDFKDKWDSFYAGSDKPVVLIGSTAFYVGPNAPSPKSVCYTTANFLLYPSCVGSVHVTSGTDAGAPLDFDSGVLSATDDIALLRYYWKRCREIGRRMATFSGEHAPDFPKFAEGSAAGVAPLGSMTVPVDAPDLVYSEADDRAIDELLKSHVLCAWHAPREDGGVVDPRLNVYGVQGLKVADMSICPMNIGGNTYSTALTIGEKAAMIIGEEFGIEGM